MALRLLQSVLPHPRLTGAVAIEILEYHLQRNATAKKSHYKIWRKKYKKVRFKVLL